MVWGFMKSYLRRHCSYNFNDLKEKIPRLIENDIPLAFFKRAERHCLRFMSGYRVGLEGSLMDFAIKKYSSHRRISAGLIGEIKRKFEEDKSKNKK